MNSQLPQLLIVDDDESYKLGISQLLSNQFSIQRVQNGDQALAAMKTHRFDLILLDVAIRTEDEGLLYIPRFKQNDQDVTIVMASGRQDFQTVREALVLGADDYVAKDAPPEELLLSIKRALQKRELLRKQNQQLKENNKFSDKFQLLGKSDASQTLRLFLEKVRRSDANVLITGETGSGKEIVARNLRTTDEAGIPRPFIAIDSSTIQSSVAESLLFGHEKGAFTGADQVKKGAFEDADGGIIYFDEVANMPLEIQAKLLRVIQEKEITRLGSTRVLPLNFRVICATNKNLEGMVQQGSFKEDLFQRLNVIPIHIPALRERREDILPLAEHFADQHATPVRRIQFTDDAIQVLENYTWPGNVRELNNLIAYLTAISDKDFLDVSDLPAKLFNAEASKEQAVDQDSNATIYERLAKFERQILIAEFKKQNGNISKMAAALGMDRSHLYTKLKTYGLFMTRDRRSSYNLSQLNPL